MNREAPYGTHKAPWHISVLGLMLGLAAAASYLSEMAYARNMAWAL